MRRVIEDVRPLVGIWLVMGLIAVGPGCRSNGEGATSTVAQSRRFVPRGEVIPPAGLGVDLVKKRAQPHPVKGDRTVLPTRSMTPEASPFGE